MPEKITTTPLIDYFVNLQQKKPTKLDAINQMIDWRPVAKKLDKALKRGANAVGKPAYPGLLLFKALVLQRMYNLSDVELEEQIRDRISFHRFLGLGVSKDVPDSTTFCRFRQELLGEKLAEKLFKLIFRQVEAKGEFKQGVSVDATVVQSCRRPRKTLENIPDDRKESPDQEDVKISYSDDTDASWLRKGNQVCYGYKAHMAVDSESGYIVGGLVTPANHSDMKELEKVLTKLPPEAGGRCYADKGYASKENREVVRRYGFKDGIMNKAARGKGLSRWEKRRNKFISSIRSGIERVFGTLKRSFGFYRSHYKGRAKVEQEFILVALCYNLVHARTRCFA